MQNRGANDDVELQQATRSKRASQVVSLAGMVLYILAAIPDVLAYSLVPQVVCVAVACLRLVLVTLLSCAFLHEVVRTREVIGMLVCCCGTFLCLCFGPNSEHKLSDARAGLLFHHAAVYSYLLAACFALVVLLVLIHWPGRESAVDQKGGAREADRPHTDSRIELFALPFATGLAFSLEKVFNTELGFLPVPFGQQTLKPLEKQLWLLFVSVVAIFGLLDFYLNMRGARRMPVQVFVPLAFAFSTSMQYFQSLFVFEEFEALVAVERYLSMAGAGLSLLGALCIQPPNFGTLSALQGEAHESAIAAE